MAKVLRGQASFAWESDTAAPGREALPERLPSPRQPRRAREPQQKLANAGESQLPPDNELWDVRAAARFLKRSVSWVYHRAEDGTLPARRLGGRGVRFIPGELRAWVDSGAAGRADSAAVKTTTAGQESSRVFTG